MYSEKEITLKSIFQAGFDLEKMIQKELRISQRNNMMIKESDYRKWIKNETFENFTIRKDGINFSTDFNAIYGKQSVTIPFGKLKPYIKKDSAVYRLASN